MLQKDHYYLEYILAIILIAQASVFFYSPKDKLFGYDIKFILVGVFMIVCIMKKIFEGHRIHSLVLFFTETVIIGELVLSTGILKFVCLVFALLYAFCLCIFISYKFPKPNGPYKAGFKTLDGVFPKPISVFYPTEETTHDRLWIDEPNYWEKMYEAAKLTKGPSIPKFLFGLLMGFLGKVRLLVNVNAKLTNKISPKYEVLIFIHGLSAHANYYSVILTYLASYGYIIFSIPIDEPINFPNDNREVRREGLMNRFKRVQTLLDMLYSEKSLLHVIFPDIDKQCSINLNNINIMGHSFGGSTALYTAAKDNRITGRAILLDPWFYPLPDDLDLNNLKKPFLSLKAESFEEEFPMWNNEVVSQGILSHTRNAKISKNSHIYIIKNSGHNSCTDLPFFMTYESKLFNTIMDTRDIYDQIDILRRIIKEFLEDKIDKEEEKKKFDINSVLPEAYAKMLTRQVY